MARDPIVETIRGTVERANGSGFMLIGRAGWLNLSKYAEPAPLMPDVGQVVAVGLDKAGFVRAVAVEGEQDDLPFDAPLPEPPREAQADALLAQRGDVARLDRTALRLGVLRTATTILASGGQATDINAVLALAERLEAWATR